VAVAIDDEDLGPLIEIRIKQLVQDGLVEVADHNRVGRPSESNTGTPTNQRKVPPASTGDVTTVAPPATDRNRASFRTAEPSRCSER
jgi:hypothetical protein